MFWLKITFPIFFFTTNYIENMVLKLIDDFEGKIFLFIF